MNLLEKLDALKKSTGDTNASLARNAGIPVTTIYGLYEKGYGNMKLSTLEALCNYFNVTLDYLAKDDNEEEPATVGELSENEAEFIQLLGAMTPANRRLILGIAQLLLKEQEAPADSPG